MTGLFGIGLAMLLVCAAYGAVRAVRPIAAALNHVSWLKATGRQSRVALAWLTARISAQIIVLVLGAALVFTLA